MAKQAISWVSPYGHPKQRNIVGQIYFPFDGDELDKDDMQKIDSLASYYIIALLGNRVTLTFEGHADYRGSANYNRRLGQRRADAVKAHFDRKLGRSYRYYSSSTVSFGEKYAGRKDIHLDRRVSIISSYVPKRRPIRLPPIHIDGKIPRKLVSRPVQFIVFEHHRIFGEGPPFNVIIIEKNAMVDEAHSYPFNARITDSKVHKSLPTVLVNRFVINWRKPNASDSTKKVSAVLLNILAAVGEGMAGGHGGGGFDFSEGGPALKPPNIVYKSWDEYQAKAKGSAPEYLIYKGKRFHNP